MGVLRTTSQEHLSIEIQGAFGSWLAAGVTVAFHGLFFTVHERLEEVSSCGRQRLRQHGYCLYLLLQRLSFLEGCPLRCRCTRLSLSARRGALPLLVAACMTSQAASCIVCKTRSSDICARFCTGATVAERSSQAFQAPLHPCFHPLLPCHLPRLCTSKERVIASGEPHVCQPSGGRRKIGLPRLTCLGFDRVCLARSVEEKKTPCGSYFVATLISLAVTRTLVTSTGLCRATTLPTTTSLHVATAPWAKFYALRA